MSPNEDVVVITPVKHFEYSWNSQDGVIFHGQGWQPDAPKAVICLVHGLGEHSGRYRHVAKAFGAAGYAVISFDLRGHGRSGGQRGHVKDFADFMRDIDQFVQQARYRFGDLPYFIYGHSLGGMLVLNYVLECKPDVAAVVVSAPGLRTPLRDQKIKMLAANAFAGIAPTLSMPTGLDPATLSRDPEVVRLYSADSNVHDQATLSMAKQSMRGIDRVFERAFQFPLPLLILHGSADQLVYARGSVELAGLVPDATLKIWEGFYHELHNEPEKDEVFALTVAWLDEHLPAVENE